MPTHAEIVSLLDPTFGGDVLTLGDVPIPVADLRTDFEDFRRQERFLTNFTGVWPSDGWAFPIRPPPRIKPGMCQSTSLARHKNLMAGRPRRNS